MNPIIINQKIFKPYDEMYFVSEDGEVYSNYSKKILKPNLDLHGYPRVDIHGKHMKIHKLVYLVWVGKLEDGQQINHKDDDKLNVHYSNLHSGTQKENIKDCQNNNHRVENIYYLTIYDKKINTTITFCPAKNFIKYCGHSNKSGCLKKFFNRNWFKKRYDIIEYKRINNLEELRSVTTMGDECSPVGQSLSLSEVHRASNCEEIV